MEFQNPSFKLFGRTDGNTHGRTHGQAETNMFPTFAEGGRGGIKNHPRGFDECRYLHLMKYKNLHWVLK